MAENPLFSYGLREWANEPLVAFDAFLSSLKSEGRHLRKSSFVIYRGMFQRLVQWAQGQGRTLFTLDEQALELFLEDRALGAETRHRYLLVFNALFSHLATLAQLELPDTTAREQTNPARLLLLEAPAPDREDPESLTSSELQRFLQALPEPTTWKKSRSNAMVYAIVGAGLRSGEVLALSLGEIPLKGGTVDSIWVQARKPRPARQVPVHPFAREHLSAWLQQRAKMGIPGTRVFPSSPAGAALQPVTLFRHIKAALEASKIEKRYEGATLLRNTCGVLWLERHASAQVMQWMGHATLRTTELLLPEAQRSASGSD